MRHVKVVIAASLLLSGCVIVPQYGHLRPVTKSTPNPLDYVCLKTDYFQPCKPVKRDHLKTMPGLQEYFRN